VADVSVNKDSGLRFRAKLPMYFRVGAIVLLVGLVIAIIYGLFNQRDPEFRMAGFPTSLSDEVVAVVDGYERREMEGDRVSYYVKASRATTFSDNHQELENIYLEVYSEDGQTADKLSAVKSVYVPGEDRKFTAYLAGNVSITTRDALKIDTEQLTYKQGENIAEGEELVKFERGNISGSSFGAIARIADKTVELLKDVTIVTTADADPDSAITNSKTTAGHAIYNQATERIDLNGTVVGKFNSLKDGKQETADLTAEEASIFLRLLDDGQRDLNNLELRRSVAIDVTRADSQPVNIRAGFANFDKPADRFDLRENASVATVSNGKPSSLSGSSILYEQTKRVAQVDGGAKATQGSDVVTGDVINAVLYPDRSMRNVTVRGNAELQQTTPERSTTINAAELFAAFAEQNAVTNANATGNAKATIVPAESAEYSKVTMTTPKTIELFFKGEGAIDRLTTQGRTTLRLDSPDGKPDASNKIVIADTVKTIFFADGKNIAKAEAVGDAELHVEPLQANQANYQSITNAPRFDCEFYPVGNNAKQCVAATGTKTVRTPTVTIEGRGPQTISAARLIAKFSESTKDVEMFEAVGNAKFTELDRNAVADSFNFNPTDGLVRLRGGDPAAWDSRARIRAVEIDWDTRNQRSSFRQKVSSTYYSRGDAGNATPFGSTDKPVFITSDAANIDHNAQIGVYTGNARGWQEENYIRANTISLFQKDGRMTGEGSVQSSLTQDNGKGPINASSARMSYDQNTRVVRYNENVDIRRGTDRLTGNAAMLLLNEQNEIVKSDMEGNVVITQPGKKATGDFAQYVSADETVELRGNPATVDDSVNGRSSGSQMTVYLKKNLVIGEGRTNQNSSGRIRSVYKIKGN
jgi:LPS export ABC transporter protein LptC/lipopolysaccharide transport protein LptA